MIKGWPARSAGRHSQLDSVDMLRGALEAAPVVLLITDAAGEIVYRNRRAEEMVRTASAAQGDAGVSALRENLKEQIRQATSFPDTREAPLAIGGQTIYASCTVAKFSGGYVVTWKDHSVEERTVQVLQELCDELSSTSSRLSHAGESLVDTAGQAASQAEVVSQGSQEMTESIKEISARVTNAASSTETAVNSAREAARSMEQLQESSRQIGSITQLITAIADQTKLLALNATIESARAGEMGKGFAVVAGEVKELAARTAEATAQIIEMVQGIQTESTQVAEGISGIVGLIDTVAEQQTMIAGAIEEQTATSAEMSSGMHSVAASVAASSDAAQTVLSASSTLREQASRLREMSAGRNRG